jgi:thiamine pyrophosphate-dependent acetolactate synthase large subunit-like protein
MTTRDVISEFIPHISQTDLIISSLGRTAEETFKLIDNYDRVLFLDCMGSVTGVGIGVAMSCPNVKVFAFETDGSFMYNSSRRVRELVKE